MCLPDPTIGAAFVSVVHADDTTAHEVAGSSTASNARATATSFSRRAANFSRRLTPPESLQLDPHTAKVVWRDFIFLLVGCVATSIVSYVETHAPDAQARMSPSSQKASVNPYGIVDTGYILTQPLYEWLLENRDWVDLLAALNSIVLVFPAIYFFWITIWKGDYSLSFCVITVQLLRSFCGWFTYLPPDPTYLNSHFDFPDIAHCLFQDCRASQGQIPPAMPFVSFFSGHVATMLVVGNHMWLNHNTNSNGTHSWKRWAVLIHVLNGLQILRLLATRGHYSIDIIIGWFVAVYVSNPAGRLGRYYSRGTTVQEIMPKTPQEAFEHVTGVTHFRNESRMSALLQRPEVQELLRDIQDDECYDQHFSSEGGSETTARILQETASKMMFERAQMIQERVTYIQQQAHTAVERGQERMRQQQQRYNRKDKYQ